MKLEQLEDLTIELIQRRTSSVHNINMLGLNEHANRVSGAYEKVLESEAEDKELEFEFENYDKALESADKQEFKLNK